MFGCIFEHSWWLSGEELTCQYRRCKFYSWVRKIPWGTKWQSTLVFLPGKSRGQRSVIGYTPCGRKRIRHDLVTKQQQKAPRHGFFALSIYWKPQVLITASYLDSLPQDFFLVCAFHWKRPWCWEGLGAGGEGDDRVWDGWMESLIRWTWVWVNSGSWWWTGRPGVLRFMGSQRVGHDWATDLIWSNIF